MSDNNTVEQAPVVERNGVKLALSADMFGKKSPNAGKSFWRPVLDVMNPDHVTWASAEFFNTAANKLVRNAFADIYLEAIDSAEYKSTGQLPLDWLAAEYADFSAGEAKLSELEDAMDKLSIEQEKLQSTPAWESYEPGTPLNDEQLSIKVQMKSNSEKIKGLRSQRDAIEAKYKERAAKRKAREEASPTKTPAPTV